VPLVSTTVPVGVPLEPETEMVTVRLAVVATGLGEALTLTVVAAEPVDEFQ
jgi:hypothetical protein